MESISELLTPQDVKGILNILEISIDDIPNDNGWITIKSPLRKEKKDSFGMNINNGGWIDFGTNQTGDLVNLVEHFKNYDTGEAIKFIKENSHLANGRVSRYKTNGTPEKSNTEIKFWSDPQRKVLQRGRKRLKTNEEHYLIEVASSYDCLNVNTLSCFNVGLVQMWGNDWLLFPYDTGGQLYGREDGDKLIRSLTGSKPGESFFGRNVISGNKKFLLIAKSPREAMLLHQLYADEVDVIGLVTGEQGTFSERQKGWLREKVSDNKYQGITILLDCDTESSYQVARQLCLAVKDLVSVVPVYLTNIDKASGGRYKDITDCVRDGMPPDVLWDIIEHSEPVKQEIRDSNLEIPLEEDSKDEFCISMAPVIPEKAYRCIPPLLRKVCELIDGTYRRDVFLMSALPAIASQMPNVFADHKDGIYSPDLFTQIIADPGSGKGIAKYGRMLAKVTDQKIRRESQIEIKDYE
jgi:hypothetical protein